MEKLSQIPSARRKTINISLMGNLWEMYFASIEEKLNKVRNYLIYTIPITNYKRNCIMKIKDYNLLNVGVGGQGVIRAMQILAWSAMEDGYQVRTAETHGMAQRGGSVASFLRFGTKVDGPLIPRGRTDVLLAFESSEALRYLDYAGPETYIIVNQKRMIPPTVTDIKNYPSINQIKQALKNVSENVFIINGTDLAIKAGNSRALNVVMIGLLYGLNKLKLNKDILKESILRFVPKKAREVNEIAFNVGIDKGKKLEEIIYE